MALSGPLGTAALLMQVPGPCTSFNGVSVGVADAAAKDAREASTTPGQDGGGCDAGIQVSWAAGPSTFCQNHANEACCTLLVACTMGDPTGCLSGIQCINDCSAPRGTAPGTCVHDCFEKYPGMEATVSHFETCFYDGGGGNGDAGACRWVQL
jgi:hypothetical protein